MKVHPITLGLWIIAIDLVAVAIAFVLGASRPEIVLLVLNVLVLLVLYFVHACGGIRFGEDED